MKQKKGRTELFKIAFFFLNNGNTNNNKNNYRTSKIKMSYH